MKKQKPDLTIPASTGDKVGATPDSTPTQRRVVDPEKYARMSVPFASQAEADAAVAEFNAGVRALREKCRIADVYVIVSATIQKPAGQPSSFLSTFNCGSSEKRLPMTAAAFGFEKSNHDKMIEDLVNGTRAAED